MNAIQYAKKWGAVDSFLARLGLGVSVLENPSEDIVDQVLRGKKPKLHKMAMGAVLGRVEENYLYYTRRFPLNTANNTIGSGAVASGDYTYFANGVGDQASVAGYASLTTLTLQQTNFGASGRIPTGRAFKLYDLGVSFNAQAAPGDVAQCLDCMNLRYEKGQGGLTVFHGPLKFWPGGTGLYGYAATTATTTTIAGASNGMPTLSNVRRFRQPREIGANESFGYVINATANLPKSNTAVALTDFVEITIWLFGHVADRITG